MKILELKKETSTIPYGASKGVSTTKKPITRHTPVARVGVKEIHKVYVLKSNEILSEFQVQFKAKQQIKEFYGDLSEKSFQLLKGQNKINLLEKRLDVIIFRLGFARSVQEARVLIKSGLILINDNLVSKKAYKKIVSVGSKITVLNSGLAYLAKISQLKFNLDPQPTHLIVSIKDQLTGYLVKEPVESEIYLPYKFPINKI